MDNQMDKMDAHPEMPLPSLKDLASSDPHLRNHTLQTLLTHLSSLPSSTPLTHLQSLQIWLPLFHTLYLHDPPTTTNKKNSIPPTPALISTLTIQLLHTTIPRSNPHLKSSLTLGFWETISREWSGIDRHRIDKFLALVRGMLRAVLEVAWASTQAEPAETEQNMSREEEKTVAREMVEKGLGTWVCSTGRGSKEGRMVPDGLRYHVLDIWVDELEGVFREEEEEIGGEEVGRRKEMLEMVMPLVERMSKEALTKGVRVRAKEVLADERLKEWM